MSFHGTTTQKYQNVLFLGLRGPEGSRPSTLQDVAQGLGLSGAEAGFEGPSTGWTNGLIDVCVCVGLCPILTKYSKFIVMLHFVVTPFKQMF